VSDGRLRFEAVDVVGGGDDIVLVLVVVVGGTVWLVSRKS
jgi:hypothetical protein